MTFVITQTCCNDASCVAVCPVDCIRPTPEDPGFAAVEMLHIDPSACVDCGACVPVCPTNAIRYEDDLPEALSAFKDINADYFQHEPLRPRPVRSANLPTRPSSGLGTLRVAIVGAGAAACYAAEDLASRADVAITMVERLATPYGLVRAGVAPDHRDTKDVGLTFGPGLAASGVDLHLNVEVGKHVMHQDLMRHHHAVIYAVGAFEERRVDIPGEDLPGSHPASEFVAWYNGHPDFAEARFDLSGRRAVVIGNGNVALDVARILLSHPKDLGKTDMAEHALDALRESNIREVVVLGRRGARQAAYSSSEFLAWRYLSGIDVVIDTSELHADPRAGILRKSGDVGDPTALKWRLAEGYAQRPSTSADRRIVFRYGVSPVEILGAASVEGIRIGVNELVDVDGVVAAIPTGRTEDVETSLVLRSVGFRGRPQPGLPFDERRGVVPNEHGRVVGDDGAPIPGVYVAGWIKRGANGTIGMNRQCSRDTVERVVDDFAAGRLRPPAGDPTGFKALAAERQPEVISMLGWRAIDQAERRRGAALGRPRVKFTRLDDMLDVAHRR